jgi:hypothetical protein
MTNNRVLALLALMGLTALGACTTLGWGDPVPQSPAARALDYLNDDLGTLVFALDLPTSVTPLPTGSLVTLEATTAANGNRHVQALLTLADGDAIDSALPAPASGRNYYFLGLSDKDKKSLRDAQKWAKALPAGMAPVFALNLVPRLCASDPADPVTTRVAVLLALPNGPPLEPLVPMEPLATFLAETGATSLPACAGH